MQLKRERRPPACGVWRPAKHFVQPSWPSPNGAEKVGWTKFSASRRKRHAGRARSPFRGIVPAKTISPVARTAQRCARHGMWTLHFPLDKAFGRTQCQVRVGVPPCRLGSRRIGKLFLDQQMRQQISKTKSGQTRKQDRLQSQPQIVC